MAVPSTAGRRRESITQQLAQENVVRVTELSRQFGVSEVSIRRDLEHLERQGLLQRVHGGAVAVAVGHSARELVSTPGPHLDEKRRIGIAAAALVRPGDRVLFDSGTTVLEVARSLSNDLVDAGNLTAITSSLPIVQELGHRPLAFTCFCWAASTSPNTASSWVPRPSRACAACMRTRCSSAPTA